METFEVGINPQWPGEKLPRGDSRWGHHTASFSAETHTLNSFSVRVAGDGCSFAPVMKDNYRDGANFISAQHLVLDDDRETLESSLEALAEDPFIRDHAAVLYETPTSTPEQPRSRVVFILDDPILNSSDYRLAQESLLFKFGETDPTVKDSARFFYGRQNARHLILGNVLYRDVLQEQLIEPYQTAKQHGTNGTKPSEHLGEVFKEGSRNTTLASLAGTMRARGMSEPAIRAALSEENQAKCNPPLLEEEVGSIAHSIGKYPAGARVAPLHCTDLGNAERLADLHGADFKYCWPLRTFFIYNGKRWCPDDSGIIYALAANTALSVYDEVKQLTEDAKVASTEEERASKNDHAQSLLKWAKTSENRTRIEAMVKQVRSISGVAVSPDQFDSDPWLLNFLNGTLDLRTQQLRDHQRSDFITNQVPVSWDPEAYDHNWDDFLNQVLPDPGVREFVQRATGYSLTGLTTEEVLFFVYGVEATGKTTMLRAIASAMGDYASVADFGTFLSRDKNATGPRNDVATLAGKRLVISVEVDPGQRLAEALIKQLTGGDKSRARFLYKESFEFLPTFKIWLAANDRPYVRDDDGAMWRRILQVPFNSQIPEADRNKLLKPYLCDPSRAGAAILRWAVEGCSQWQREGLQIPDVVREATNSYRIDLDPLKEFTEECCIKGGRTSCKDAFNAYALWAKENHLIRPLGRNNFTTRMEAKGYVRKREGHRFWEGFHLEI